MSILKNWCEEKSAVFLYTQLAKREVNSVRKKLFADLAQVAEKQAQIWAVKIKQTGIAQHTLVYRPDLRTRLVSGLIGLFGIEPIRFILSAMKVRGMSIYTNPSPHHLAAAHLETRHKGLNTAGNLRAAVFGVSDGLVSNASLLCGMVGAHADHKFLVLSGMAGLLAGACSMAVGEYISMRSQQEFFEYQISLEREELELYPEEEAAELACIYRARGIPKEEAKKAADLIISHPEKALDTLAREELGLNPADLGSPYGAAISSFLSFGFGAFVPLLPFLYFSQNTTVFYSVALTALALLVIGGTLSLFTNRSAWLSGLRMLFIGSLAGSATFFIGKWLGVALS